MKKTLIITLAILALMTGCQTQQIAGLAVPSESAHHFHDNDGVTYSTYTEVYAVCVRTSDGKVWDVTNSAVATRNAANWEDYDTQGTIDTDFNDVRITLPTLPTGAWDVYIYGSADGTADAADDYLTGFRVVSPYMMTAMGLPQ